MDDESYQSFPATAEDPRRPSRRRNHSIHVQSQTYGLLPLGLATPVGSTFFAGSGCAHPLRLDRSSSSSSSSSLFSSPG